VPEPAPVRSEIDHDVALRLAAADQHIALGWLLDRLGIPPRRDGRVQVGPDLTVPGHPEIFVIGDTAEVEGPHGPLPGVAPVAKQEGAYVVRVIAARLAGKPVPPPFRYRDLGNLATIGRTEAVVDFGWPKLTGRLAWLVWGGAHIYFLIGFLNRMAVAVDWLWSYLTYQRGARLITGEDMRIT
jgi:NADH dehydrogenase